MSTAALSDDELGSAARAGFLKLVYHEILLNLPVNSTSGTMQVNRALYPNLYEKLKYLYSP